MDFSIWLFTEEQQKYVRTRKDISPKNPANSFLVLYGADKEEKDLMFSFKDELKRMGFGYYRPAGTYSIFSTKVDDAMRNKLSQLGVDFSGYDSGQVVTSATPTTQTDTPADQNLEQMHNELSKVIADDPKTQELIDSIERMIERIANSTDEAAKQAFIRNFFQFAGKFYDYSMHNQFLIWIQTKGRANYVATENQWTERFGRAVRDHKSFISLLRPNNTNDKKKESDDKKKEPALELDSDTTKKKTGRLFFTAYKVYDVSATVPIPGHPSPFEPMTRKQWSVDSNEDVEEVKQYIAALSDWAKENNINVAYEELDPELGGYSAGGKVAINNVFKGINHFSTFVHEVAHEILHWKDKDKKSTKMEKEIDAESTAFIVLSHFGFETKDTSNYLAMWRAKGDDIRARRRNIQKASEEIINGIKSKMTEEQPKEESDIEENTQHNSAIIKVYRADGVIHANINGEEKKFEVDKFYFQELRDSKNAYKTLMELVRKGYASELTSPKRPAND
jgi:hypothetical protein